MLLLYKQRNRETNEKDKFKNISCYYYMSSKILNLGGYKNLKTSHVTIISESG